MKQITMTFYDVDFTNYNLWIKVLQSDIFNMFSTKIYTFNNLTAMPHIGQVCIAKGSGGNPIILPLKT